MLDTIRLSRYIVHIAVEANAKGGKRTMTDRSKFMQVVIAHGKKLYEVAALLGMSPQSLYNKLGNTTEFTQSELSKFRKEFPDVSTEEFESIFFTQPVAVQSNE